MRRSTACDPRHAVPASSGGRVKFLTFEPDQGGLDLERRRERHRSGAAGATISAATRSRPRSGARHVPEACRAPNPLDEPQESRAFRRPPGAATSARRATQWRRWCPMGAFCDADAALAAHAARHRHHLRRSTATARAASCASRRPASVDGDCPGGRDLRAAASSPPRPAWPTSTTTASPTTRTTARPRRTPISSTATATATPATCRCA